jgi:hypothetical protein
MNEKNPLLVGVDNLEPLRQGEEMHTLNVNYGKKKFCLSCHHYDHLAR